MSKVKSHGGVATTPVAAREAEEDDREERVGREAKAPVARKVEECPRQGGYVVLSQEEQSPGCGTSFRDPTIGCR